MKITAIRHGPFSPVNRGKPTPEAMRRFLAKTPPPPSTTIVACSKAPRACDLAKGLSRKHKLGEPVVIPEFDPLKTVKFPSLFGGWLYEVIHRSWILNQLILILWWNGFPFFTDGPVEFLERIGKGLQLLQEQAGDKDVMLICHHETFVALMIRAKKSPFRALRRRIPHFHTETFEVQGEATR